MKNCDIRFYYTSGTKWKLRYLSGQVFQAELKVANHSSWPKSHIFLSAWVLYFYGGIEIQNKSHSALAKVIHLIFQKYDIPKKKLLILGFDWVEMCYLDDSKGNTQPKDP